MTAAYLVLDLINDIVHADGPNGAQGFGPEVRRRKVLENTATALAAARSAGTPVGYIRVGFSAGYVDCPPNTPRFQKAKANGILKIGTWGTEAHESVAPAAEDFDIVKHRVGPFYGTTLEPTLRAIGATTLVVSGVSTNAVVQSTVREGYDRDYQMVILEDACSALSEDEHAKSIELLSGFATVTSSTDINFSSL